MLLETLDRLDGLETGTPIVVCAAVHAEGVREVLAGTPAEVIVEPEGRNTAPAIALAALHTEPDDVLVVLPADHLIEDLAALRRAVEEAVDHADAGYLVTFGIVASHPATGYGWIEPGEGIGGTASGVESFREKPDPGAAQDYLERGWLWNSGMFAFTAGRYLDELAAARPDIDVATRAAAADGLASYGEVPKESVDYAVMEPTSRAVVVPLDAGWTDIGSWRSLWRRASKDEHGNAVRGDAVVIDSEDSLVVAASRPVAVVGVDGVAVIESADGVVVVPLERAEEVKRVVEALGSD